MYCFKLNYKHKIKLIILQHSNKMGTQFPLLFMNYKYILQMDILDKEQLLEHQLQLLNEPGPNLSSFYLYSPEESIFVSPSPIIKSFLFQQYKVDASLLKTCLNHANTCLQIFTSLILKIFYEGSQQLDMLQNLKCTLYSKDVKIENIKNMPKRNLSSNVMKKMLVEFFQVMQYHSGNVESMLDKYPIVVQIFILFFRTILAKMAVEGANDFRATLNANQALTFLFDYFDFHYQIRKGLFVLGEGELFLYIDADQNNIIYGEKGLKEIQHEDKYENQFNFEEAEDILDLGLKDESAPTPYFAVVKDEDTIFHRKTNEQNSGRKRKCSNQQIREITQTEEYEESQSQKRQSKSESRTEEKNANFQIYFSEDTNYIQTMNIDKFESANSSPSQEVHGEIVVQRRQQRNQRRQSNNPIHITESLISDKNDNKSDIFPMDHSEHCNKFKKKNEEETSVYSCSCSSVRAKKNSLQSNVFGVDFRKDFTKKNVFIPQSKSQPDSMLNSRVVSERNHKTQIKKNPQNSSRRPPYYNSNINSQFTERKMMEKAMGFSRKDDGRPKVYFTYHQPNDGKGNMKEHIYTEPANIKGHREMIYGQNEQMKKMGSQLQGNPRKYKNYAQQKIKYI